MTQYQSRRERREAEAASNPAPETALVTESRSEKVSEGGGSQLAGDSHLGLTRRERRMVESGQSLPERPATTPPPSMVIVESLAESRTNDQGPRSEVTPRLVTGQDSDSMFTGTNLLGEPKTQSIVLPAVPELALQGNSTGEILTTGSISIISEAVESVITGSLDGLELDRLGAADAVTGALSVVQPVSALTVIRERESVAVVPTHALRRGWWQPWLIGAAALLMLAAAIFTTLLIVEAVGG